MQKGFSQRQISNQNKAVKKDMKSCKPSPLSLNPILLHIFCVSWAIKNIHRLQWTFELSFFDIYAKSSSLSHLFSVDKKTIKWLNVWKSSENKKSKNTNYSNLSLFILLTHFTPSINFNTNIFLYNLPSKRYHHFRVNHFFAALISKINQED